MAFKLADFFVDLKVVGDTMTLKTMVNSMADMKLETLGEIGALGALGLALKQVGTEAMQLSVGYTAINAQYGTNIEMLQRWQNVARASSVPVQDVAQTFTRMQTLLASPLIGNPNSAFMRAAGIMGIKDANRMTAEQLNNVLTVAVPRYIARMTPSQGRENAITNAGSLVEAMGATRSMMQLYTLPQNVRQARERSSDILGSGQVKQWTELNSAIDVTKHNFFMLGEGILVEALPGLLAFANAMARFTVGLEGFLSKNFKEASSAAEAPWGGGGNATQSDVIMHALASWLVPNIVSGNAGRQVVLHQSNDTDIHVYGEPGGQMPEQIRRNQERLQQHQMTRAMQTLQAKVAY